MKQDGKTGKVTTTIQEVAYYNIFLTEAILRVARGERNPDRRRGIGARQETEERNPATVPMDAIKLGTCYDLLSGERNGCRGLQLTDEPSSEPHAKSVSDLAHWPSPTVGEVCSEIAHPCQSYPMPVRQTSL